MNTIKLLLAVMVSMLLVACGGGSTANAPGSPTGVTVAAGNTAGTTAFVSFTAPSSDGGSAITGYTVTANPGGITASGTTSPITLTGLVAGTAYTYSVVATNSTGNSAPATTGQLNFYSIVETFHEPMTQPNDSIFTGSFTYDSDNHTVSNLKGSLTESMMTPMTTVPLTYQLSAVSNPTLGGLLVTAFALNTTDVFSGGGFAPGSSTTFGNQNAYAMVFVNTTDPTTPLTQAQIDKLAYADCTANGLMMMNTVCMTGTDVAGYGTLGSMNGYPLSQVITKLGAPGAPTGVTVAVDSTVWTTANVSFTAPSSDGGSTITGYTVTANPGGITASGTASPIALTGLTPQTAYTYSVVATNSAGNSAPATTGQLNFYSIVETFYEPMTQPRNTIFTGSFTFDSTAGTVSHLTGSISESMKNPMTYAPLTYQLSAVSDPTLGGLLVTTFALNTTDVFSGGGFAPGSSTTFGNQNAYAMIFVNTTDPTTSLTQSQIDKLAYADCTANGLMMMNTKCMTGTDVAGYGTLGSMNGYPLSQVITKQ